ncbi:adenosine deaminase family protein [Oscillatoria acuminata]|uniref:Adenosine deaminase n=1 Tax=Oscillatoria acuminata PCC 6304 TaxID=56110 RepID=K9TRR2_9CYAN|nr:adenosine deaminase [Oscillatoria acuminata]AFY84826.1 adenosine deaminase [Oscillatoria acuminata PCC 6304]
MAESEPNRILVALAQMPKAELHLHLEAAPRWSTLREALHRHHGRELPQTPLFHAPDFRFADFDEFKGCFRHYIYPWLQTKRGYAELMEDVVDSLVEQRIRYVELNFNVATVDLLKLDLETVLEQLAASVATAGDRGTTIRIIAGIDRSQGSENARLQVQRLIPYPLISGFDLHGLETPETRADRFQDAWATAKEAGRKVKVHAGEMDGPASIYAAVATAGITQIGHGTSAIESPEVVNLLLERGVVVEMCPTSNERLGNVSSYQNHPILALDEAGVKVTVNSDDPTWFGLNLTQEMQRLIRDRQVSLDCLTRWTRNAFEVAIADDAMRSQFFTELQTWQQTHCPSLRI